MRSLILFGLLACSTICKAEDCASVIALSKTSSSTVSSKNSFESAAARFCNDYSRFKSSGSAMNAGGSYGPVSASFGQSSTDSDSIASRICSASDNSKKSDDAYEEYINSIAPGAYGAYQQCLALNNSDISFRVDEAAILPKRLTMTVAYVSHQGRDRNAALTYSSSDGVSCKWSTGDTANIQVQSPQSVSLDCRRDSSDQKAFITVIRTDGGSKITLPWPRYNSDGVAVNTVSNLEQRLAELAGRLDVLANASQASRASLAQVSAAVKADQSAISYSIVPNTSSCPSGWTRLGVIGFIVLNSDYATANLGQGGIHNDGWTWTHPLLCRRN